MNRRSRCVVSVIAVSCFTALAGCGSDDTNDAGGTVRDVAIEAVEFAFSSEQAIVIETGDTIRFRVTNAGTIDHEMEVLTDASRRVGKTERIPPGQQRDVTVTFEEPGVYTAICDIDDHRSQGQQAQFEVTDPTDGPDATAS